MSTWYVAHIIMYVEYKSGEQEPIPVWENIVLIEADSDKEAFAEAEEIGKSEAVDDDGGFAWMGRPARWVFGGVRKLTFPEGDGRPGHGTEVTYLQLRLASKQDLKKLVDSEKVNVMYDEPFSRE